MISRFDLCCQGCRNEREPIQRALPDFATNVCTPGALLQSTRTANPEVGL